jgi:hypothetical protein
VKRTLAGGMPLLALAVALAPAGTWAETAAPDVHFPGQRLDGTSVTLPDAAAGKPCIVVVGMTRNSAVATHDASVALAKHEGDRASVYSIALLDKVPGLFRGWVLGALRKQLDSPDGKAPSYFLTTFDGTTLRRLAPTGAEDEPATYVFDAHGGLLAAFRVASADDAVAAAVKVLPDP